MKRILVLGGVGAMANETTRDLVATSNFDEITIADIDVKKAKAFASGLKDKRLKVVGFDANKISDMVQLMKGYDVVANGLPRIYSEKAIKAAIVARVNILDLISLEEETLSLDGKAKRAGISAVGGVGITPGITIYWQNWERTGWTGWSRSISILRRFGLLPIHQLFYT